MSELDGFVVYKPNEAPCFISAHDKSITVSSGAFKALGSPEWANVFLDECRQRVMIKAAEPQFKNVLKMVEHSAGKNRVICNRELTVLLHDMFGRGSHIMGHLVADGCMIFDRFRMNRSGWR